MVEILKELSNGNPEKSKIEINDICSDCKRDITIEMTSTTGGFGLQVAHYLRNRLAVIMLCALIAIKLMP